MSRRMICLAMSDEEIAACFPVMAQLRNDLIEDEFVSRVRQLKATGYQLVSLNEEGVVKAVAGFRVLDFLATGQVLLIDDLVTDSNQRSNGLGDALFDWLVEFARNSGCKQVRLNSGVQRGEAHRFYFRKRMKITGYHFALSL